MKSVLIRSYFWSVFSRIRTEYGGIFGGHLESTQVLGHSEVTWTFGGHSKSTWAFGNLRYSGTLALRALTLHKNEVFHYGFLQ